VIVEKNLRITERLFDNRYNEDLSKEGFSPLQRVKTRIFSSGVDLFFPFG
jgi:hypothetical protein